MSSTPQDPAAGRVGDHADEPFAYPAGQVVAVLDSDGQAADALAALTGSGFSADEVHVDCGAARADELRATTGRRGLAGMAIRIASRLGVQDPEMEFKSHYEQAMRDGRYVVRVTAPTDERKALAVRLLEQHGAHAISYHGSYTIEGVVPPRAR